MDNLDTWRESLYRRRFFHVESCTAAAEEEEEEPPENASSGGDRPKRQRETSVRGMDGDWLGARKAPLLRDFKNRTNYCIPLFPEISFVPVRGIDRERTKLPQIYLCKTGLFRLLFRQSSVFLSLNPFAAQETSPSSSSNRSF